ncbi:MAG TPA: RdgB/HAM1 family non-canonical purine NTP pyrophosphatase [Polyangiaceae bacterium]|nr:RdgB/HAM1 family non-canonical purine NTP pyrophosphatase [Polyangiaceae bacterium]
MSKIVHSLVVATNNRGKLEELRALLEGLPIELLTLADVGAKDMVIVEDGATFEENAIKKARAVAEATMMLTLADDSGLEVDALGGQPGVRSARFAHERATDSENNAALLGRLEEVGDARDDGRFPARFRCVLALVDPYEAHEPHLSEGRCEGAITRTPRGTGGFGYDPLFLVEGGDKTMAELAAEEKNRISHRALACLRLRPVLERTLLDRDEKIRKILDA